MEKMSITNYNGVFKDKGEWPGLVPCKWTTSKKIIDRPKTSEDYYSSIITL